MKNLFALALVFGFSSVAFSYLDQGPCYKEFLKVKKYNDKLSEWDTKLTECKEAQASDASISCFWEVEKVKFYNKKVNKWQDRLNVCEEYHNS